ncbi:DUF4175 family protein [Tenacibaculum maritimum]|uniref:DUF4175 family protein n=1 Tax=Tenacibaculum maritimum TaxID=107401 RepID=UPI00388EC4F4
MSEFQKIEQKLQQFSKKYYTNELIKGSILFLSLGFLYFFLTLFIEYFLWLKPTARTILFWIFILVEIILLIRFILFPLFKLIGLQKGISLEESSKIIGNHFPDVKDKLLNVLQLKRNSNPSDLLLASIEQKSNDLKPIPFTKAINFRNNLRYLKYALVPVFVCLLTFFTGSNAAFTESFKRVVNHRTAYTPPAPFYFYVKEEKLNVIEGNSLHLVVEVNGDILPEEVKIHFQNQSYYLQKDGAKNFSYTFSEIRKPLSFYVEANSIQSKTYQINVIKTPTIQKMAISLSYPKYIGKPNEIINNTGNLIVPRGTIVKWSVFTHQTDTVLFIDNHKSNAFIKEKDNKFHLSKRILNDIHYQIATSNKNLKNYELLQYTINTIKDEHPQITISSNIDSISRGPAQFAGQISDDYGFHKLELVYYDKKLPENTHTFKLTTNQSNVQTFFYEFPEGLELKEGVDYELFFQVFDNDVISGYKKASSKKFSYRKKTTKEVDQELLQEQKNTINDLEKSINKQQQNKSELEKIQFDLQNKKNINWNDQKKIKQFIKRQEQYKEMMQRQTHKLQENLSEKKESSKSLQTKKEALKERVEELKKLDKQQKLLEELRKMAEKLNKDDLLKKAKEIAQQNKQQERSLERILELTKRFYIEQKINQISEKLNSLSKKQHKLSETDTSLDEQKKLNKEFKKIQDEFKELQKSNQKLNDPMKIPSMDELQKQTNNALDKATENIESKKEKSAKKNQKNAAKKMQQMSSQMQQSMQQMSNEMEEENMDDLRQVLENLLTFSFQQEELMNAFNTTTTAHPNFGKNLKKQYQLKTYFEHIDDSLYVLSMRVPKISTKIQDQLSLAHYNLEQSLENFTESRFRNGISNQRYTMTAANTLADMLSNVLNSMQNPRPGNGKGKGKGQQSFSLPDIIKKQSELLKKMEDGLQKSKDGKPKKDGKGKQQGSKGEQNSEKMNGDLFEIYKQQSALREQLENAIKNGSNGNGAAKKALKTMEQLENSILEKGFNKTTLQKMQELNYQLLKLDKATFKQGKDKKRKSNTNVEEYKLRDAKKLKFKKLFYNQTEILNRQSLPLRQNYKKKVQEYFSPSKNN